jgi:hypothetical protein
VIDFDSSPSRYRGTIEVYATPTDDPWPPGQPLLVEWRWRCKSRNGQILGHSEGYRRKAGALNAIDAMFGHRFPVGFSEWLNDAAEDSSLSLEEMFALPWRLVIHDRHGNTTTGAVY